MHDSKNKKVLLIAPSFYGYDEVIFSKLQENFNKVYYINETVNNHNLYYKFYNNFKNNRMQEVMTKYFISSIKKIPSDIDYVFCIRCYYLDCAALDFMRKYFVNSCKFINYQWDSSDIVPIIRTTHKLYDKVFSFDFNDVAEYGWKYRPLFYIKEKVNNSSMKLIDVFSVGSFNINRYLINRKFENIFKANNINYKIYLYGRPLRFMFDKFIAQKHDLKNVKLNDVTLKSFSINSLYSFYSNSKCILDNTLSEQTGFTMRTIESIGNHCKIITNNKNILNADFYNKKNVYVYDNDNLSIEKDFILSSYEELPDEIYYKYSLDSFIEDIFLEVK